MWIDFIGQYRFMSGGNGGRLMGLANVQGVLPAIGGGQSDVKAAHFLIEANSTGVGTVKQCCYTLWSRAPTWPTPPASFRR